MRIDFNARTAVGLCLDHRPRHAILSPIPARDKGAAKLQAGRKKQERWPARDFLDGTLVPLRSPSTPCSLVLARQIKT